MKMFIQICFLTLTLGIVSNAKVLRGPVDIRADTLLTIEGKKFYYGPDQVYLSGTNPAWINYGYDFGNNQWETTTSALWTQEVQEIAAAGGNSIRY